MVTNRSKESRRKTESPTVRRSRIHTNRNVAVLNRRHATQTVHGQVRTMADKSTPTADITRRCLLVAGTTSAALGLAGCASGDGGAETSDASPTTGGADSAQHAQPLSITQTDA